MQTKVPDYLSEYFDEEELDKLSKEFSKDDEEILTEEEIDLSRYTKEEKDLFWKENKVRLVKRHRRLGKHLEPVYVEPLRNEERVDDERDLTEEEVKTLIKMCESDLYLFAVRYFAHYLTRPSSEFHKYLYKLLADKVYSGGNDKGVKWAIAAPRGSAKSSLVSCIFPLWCICYNKKRFIIIISDTIGQAEDFLADIKRELEFNAKLLRDFPHVVGKGPMWRGDEITTASDIKVKALGTGSKIRGRRYGKHRPDLVVGDDVENTDMVRSESQRDFIRYQWFNKDLLHAGGEEGTKTDFFVVGTILGKDSLLNALLNPNEYPQWNSKRFKAVLDFSYSPLWDEWAGLYKDRFNEYRKETAKKFFEDHKEEMLEGTEVLWPEGDPYYSLMEERISDPSSFSSEKQNESVDPTKVLVSKDQLHFEDFSSTKKIIDILEDKRNPRFGALDPSLGKKATSGDYSCIITIVRDIKSGYLFVVDISLQRRSVEDQIYAILAYDDEYHYKLFAVETNAFQYVVAENLRKKSRELGKYVNITDINVYQDKKMRVEGIIPLLLDGTIVFDSNKYSYNQQYNMAIEQLCTFTGEADKHDDAPDALSLVVSIAKKPKFKLVVSQNK